jgi:hypothetical protein
MQSHFESPPHLQYSGIGVQRITFRRIILTDSSLTEQRACAAVRQFGFRDVE